MVCESPCVLIKYEIEENAYRNIWNMRGLKLDYKMVCEENKRKDVLFFKNKYL